jgi:hypothetical protein
MKDIPSLHLTQRFQTLNPKSNSAREELKRHIFLEQQIPNEAGKNEITFYKGPKSQP